ncbi:uncharacterized protein EV420DRAFT_1265922 [Desarmillaria tabescens]|uniref:1-acyl-sn-glycerol-3-phosphate acyltransferase n=1 Tax=Armillaria tabescens TaxID=1929756 RepID=A0AA39N9Q5_ARMTA|nr:uncharacterized protein EV420DRAFT_1265922 [Desarmillaria tabescens]KAK0461632.1 hypothetical protein EV420DRAFT_1265922 [Desarmillaria tabescens]
MAFLAAFIKPLAYISVPVIILRSVAASSPTGKYYVRLGMYIGTLTFIATWGAAIAAGMSLVNMRYDVNIVIARCFYALASRVMNIEVEIEGQEHLVAERPSVLMINHQSFLDILIVGRLIPRRTSIMAKSSIRWTPLGPFMIMSGAIFVDRGNNARAVSSLKAAGETMKSGGVSLYMYPEGTRHLSEENNLLPLKKGGFHLAIQSGIPIVPIVAENYWWLYRKGFFGTGKIKVRALPPIQTKGLTTEDATALSIRVREQMLETLNEISVNTPSQGKTVKESSSLATEAAEEAKVGATEGHSEKTPVPEATQTSTPSESGSDKVKSSISENGTETEEDEGMVLVGRPA